MLQNNDDLLAVSWQRQEVTKKNVRYIFIPLTLEACESVLLSAKLVNVNNIDPVRPGF